MKKWLKELQKKRSLINVVNMAAIAMVIYTANATCLWTQHQPEMPEAARKFRKF